jgi:16S rRNA (guanine527-N7)-methyltransferase
VKQDPPGAPPPPEAATLLFGDAIGLARRYADLLATEAAVRGLIGPREVERLWERHLVNCALVTDLVPRGASVCDLGSGAGLPGLVIAIRRPDVLMTLVEPLLRRTTFLEEAVHELGLPNVEVVRARADTLHGTRRFDAVTARAVAPLDRLSSWALPLVRTGGEFLAMKGSTVRAEVEAAAPVIRRLGGTPAEIVELGSGVVDPRVRVVRVVKE